MLSQPYGAYNKQLQQQKEFTYTRGQPHLISEDKTLSNGQPAPVPQDITTHVESPVLVQREVEKLVEIQVEKPRFIEVPVEYPVEIVVEVPKEQIISQDVIIEKIVEIPVQKYKEVPVETVYEHPVEVIVEQPVYIERVVEKPIKSKVYQETERIVVNRIPNPIHVNKEVVRQLIQPVENQVVQRPIIRKVPVWQTREVQVAVQVPYDKIVDVIVDVPVDEVIYKTVQKHIPVDKVVEKVVRRDVERVVEVPVDKVVEVPYEVLVSTDGRRYDTRERSLSRGRNVTMSRSQSQNLLPRAGTVTQPTNPISNIQKTQNQPTNVPSRTLPHSSSTNLRPAWPATRQEERTVAPASTTGQFYRSSSQANLLPTEIEPDRPLTGTTVYPSTQTIGSTTQYHQVPSSSQRVVQPSALVPSGQVIYGGLQGQGGQVTTQYTSGSEDRFRAPLNAATSTAQTVHSLGQPGSTIRMESSTNQLGGQGTQREGNAIQQSGPTSGVQIYSSAAGIDYSPVKDGERRSATGGTIYTGAPLSMPRRSGGQAPTVISSGNHVYGGRVISQPIQETERPDIYASTGYTSQPMTNQTLLVDFQRQTKDLGNFRDTNDTGRNTNSPLRYEAARNVPGYGQVSPIEGSQGQTAAPYEYSLLGNLNRNLFQEPTTQGGHQVISSTQGAGASGQSTSYLNSRGHIQIRDLSSGTDTFNKYHPHMGTIAEEGSAKGSTVVNPQEILSALDGDAQRLHYPSPYNISREGSVGYQLQPEQDTGRYLVSDNKESGRVIQSYAPEAPVTVIRSTGQRNEGLPSGTVIYRGYADGLSAGGTSQLATKLPLSGQTYQLREDRLSQPAPKVTPSGSGYTTERTGVTEMQILGDYRTGRRTVVEEKVGQMPADAQPTDRVVHYYVDKVIPKYVEDIIEKYIDVPVYKEVQVPFDVLREKIINNDKVVETEVEVTRMVEGPTVERVVDREIEIIKEIERPIYVDKKVIKEKEIVVEKVVEVPVEKFIETPIERFVDVEFDVTIQKNTPVFVDKEVELTTTRRRRTSHVNENLRHSLHQSVERMNQVSKENADLKAKISILKERANSASVGREGRHSMTEKKRENYERLKNQMRELKDRLNSLVNTQERTKARNSVDAQIAYQSGGRLPRYTSSQYMNPVSGNQTERVDYRTPETRYLSSPLTPASADDQFRQR